MDIQWFTTKKIALFTLMVVFVGVLSLFLTSEYALKKQQQQESTTVMSVVTPDGDSSTSPQPDISTQIPITPQEKALVKEREQWAALAEQAQASVEELAQAQQQLQQDEERAQAVIDSLDAQIKQQHKEQAQ